ncbi:MAG: F0F1 ATP synthase subunit B [Acidobacteriota bacterium]
MKHRTLRLVLTLVALSAVAAFSCLMPLSALAAEEGHQEGWGWIETVGRWVNLLILSGVILYFVRTPARRFFAGRATSIADEIRSSAEAYEKACSERAALEERVANIDRELATIREEAEKQANLERERVRDQARKDAERLLENARREIENETRAAQKELKEYAAELAVALAEARIGREIRPQDERKVVDRFFITLGERTHGTKG